MWFVHSVRSLGLSSQYQPINTESTKLDRLIIRFDLTTIREAKLVYTIKAFRFEGSDVRCDTVLSLDPPKEQKIQWVVTMKLSLESTNYYDQYTSIHRKDANFDRLWVQRLVGGTFRLNIQKIELSATLYYTTCTIRQSAGHCYWWNEKNVRHCWLSGIASISFQGG